MKIMKYLSACAAVILMSISNNVLAADHIIKAGSREFKPAIIYVAEGDNVKFSNMNSHNSVSVDSLLPEGATPWTSKLGENIGLTLDKKGIYPYVCQPHIGFGMVGVIVVGDVTPEEVAAVKEKAMAELQGPYRRLIGKINKIGK